MDHFMLASRKKYRFLYAGNTISTEQLWGLDLHSLNTVAKGINTALKEMDDESFIPGEQTKFEGDIRATAQSKLEVVKAIIAIKVHDAEEVRLSAERSARKRRLQELLHTKQGEALSAMTIEQIEAELKELN